MNNSFGDVRLGWRPQPDARNANFPICAFLPRTAYKKPRSRLWHCGTVLDQGKEGSCVGHAYAHDLISNPYPIKRITHASAVKIYKLAQALDEWPGQAYSGTSVLAGVKAVQKLYPGTIESYRWAASVEDIIATIGYFGPIIFGGNWYSSCYHTDEKGFIHVAGNKVGGHCVLLRGVSIQKGAFLLHNSWGTTWGRNGTAWISFSDMDRLLHENGEACIAISRSWWRHGSNDV